MLSVRVLEADIDIVREGRAIHQKMKAKFPRKSAVPVSQSIPRIVKTETNECKYLVFYPKNLKNEFEIQN
jgi:hypothetical protein